MGTRRPAGDQRGGARAARQPQRSRLRFPTRRQLPIQPHAGNPARPALGAQPHTRIAACDEATVAQTHPRLAASTASAMSPTRHSRRDCRSPPYPEAAKVAARNACGETKAGASRLTGSRPITAVNSRAVRVPALSLGGGHLLVERVWVGLLVLDPVEVLAVDVGERRPVARVAEEQVEHRPDQ